MLLSQLMQLFGLCWYCCTFHCFNRRLGLIVLVFVVEFVFFNSLKLNSFCVYINQTWPSSNSCEKWCCSFLKMTTKHLEHSLNPLINLSNPVLGRWQRASLLLKLNFFQRMIMTDKGEARPRSVHKNDRFSAVSVSKSSYSAIVSLIVT